MAQALIVVIFAAVGLGPASSPVTESEGSPAVKGLSDGESGTKAQHPSAPAIILTESPPPPVADKSPGASDPRQGSEATTNVVPEVPRSNGTPKSVVTQIRAVFGPAGAKAVAVARCESRFRTNARNGQYRGIFQMGRAERARFGHGPDALTQIRAAKSYFDVSGWRPWAACR